MKQELDYVKKVVVYPIETVTTKGGKDFYYRNMQIQSSYGSVLIVMKAPVAEALKVVEYTEKTADVVGVDVKKKK